MPYAFVQDLPSNKEMYLKLSAAVGDQPPAGLIVHTAFETSSGMRIVDVWESEEQFDAFRRERLGPSIDRILQEAGTTRESMGPPREEEITPVEVFGPGIGKRRF